MNENIVFENELCRLTVGADCLVKSLIIKKNGTECVRGDEEISLFSVTQERPFNNEVKLMHPNKRTTYQANSLVREGDRLIVGFETAPYKVAVRVKEAPSYIAFTLEELLATHEEHYAGLTMDVPPTAEFRLAQLPVINREHFGEWLNVVWDEEAAVCVLATSPHARIDSERRHGYRVLTADAVRGIKLVGCSAALIAAPGSEALLSSIAALEEDYDLPRGVENRKNKKALNSSAYWTYDINPENVDEHIKYAKLGGFRLMLIYYRALFKNSEVGYVSCGDYEYSKKYPKGRASLKEMLDKIKAAGITPGIHFLQTHIGLESQYMRPTVDRRIHLTRHFTLARPLLKTDTVIYVDQNPEGSVMFDLCRRLNFGGEMISYEAYTTEPPYCFTGCVRGFNETIIKEHPLGEIGGIIDLTEFSATSAYIDQNTDLQDEIAEKLADAYNQGFEFIYFDGSEGTNAPYEYHVPNAQYRVWKKLKTKPILTEGAAKAHFGWHFLTGGNAFDVFPPAIFKASIDRFPLTEAPKMRDDFTRINFGWWRFHRTYQPDMYEYGTSKAAAWDCPTSLMAYLDEYRNGARAGDCLEVMRRWEDARVRDLLTEEQKLALRVPKSEFHLIINEAGEYELLPYTEIACREAELSAFSFTRGGKSYVVFWHKSGAARLKLALPASEIRLFKSFGGATETVEATEGGALLGVGDRLYLEAKLDEGALRAAFENAEIIQ